MQWMSVATQQRRSATCTINTADSVTCNQDGGGHFELARSGLGQACACHGASSCADASACGRGRLSAGTRSRTGPDPVAEPGTPLLSRPRRQASSP